MSDTIDQIEVWACRVPLPSPLFFGSFTVTARRYVALRVRTAGGLCADVVGHSRGSPVDVAISDLLAPVLIGTDASDLDARRRDFLNATVALERDGVFGRAWSLLEIALQGLNANARKMPLWQHLGGSARVLPVQLVEGYCLPDESDEAFAERLSARVDEGYRALKIEGASYHNWKRLERRLQLVRRAAPACRLVVDFAWSWGRASEHVELLAALEVLGIDWIEDAFPREAIAEYAAAAKLTRAPLGCGDEATRSADLFALVDGAALKVVRLDATALGGVAAVLSLVDEFAARGCRVSLHEFAEIHEHCALAGKSVDHIEMFPADRPFDVRHKLTTASAHARVRKGILQAASESGLGVFLDLEQVARHAHRHQRIAA